MPTPTSHPSVLLRTVERLGRRVLRRAGFKSRWISTDVGLIHVYDGVGQGTLPPLLLIHGVNATATSFQGVLTRLLPKAQRVVAIDLPAHGYSEVPDGGLSADSLVAGTLQALDEVMPDVPAVVFGTSRGGIGAVR